MTIIGAKFDLCETPSLELIFTEQDIIRFMLLGIQRKSTSFVSLHGLAYDECQQDDILLQMIINRTFSPHQ